MMWCGGVVYLTDYRTTPVNIVQLCTGLGCGNTTAYHIYFHKSKQYGENQLSSTGCFFLVCLTKEDFSFNEQPQSEQINSLMGSVCFHLL